MKRWRRRETNDGPSHHEECPAPTGSTVRILRLYASPRLQGSFAATRCPEKDAQIWQLERTRDHQTGTCAGVPGTCILACPRVDYGLEQQDIKRTGLKQSSVSLVLIHGKGSIEAEVFVADVPLTNHAPQQGSRSSELLQERRRTRSQPRLLTGLTIPP